MCPGKGQQLLHTAFRLVQGQRQVGRLVPHVVDEGLVGDDLADIVEEDPSRGRIAGAGLVGHGVQHLRNATHAVGGTVEQALMPDITAVG